MAVQITDLGDFHSFMLSHGFTPEECHGEYEVARYRSPDGDKPVLVYRKKHPGIFTVVKNGHEFEYLIDEPHIFGRKSTKVVEVHAAGVTTTPPNVDDPW